MRATAFTHVVIALLAVDALLSTTALTACSAPGSPPPETTVSRNTACSTAPAPARSQIEPLFQHYCVSCHSPDGSAGEEHDFTRFDVLRAQRRRVKAVLEASAMPPRGLPQPNDAERARMIAWACAAR